MNDKRRKYGAVVSEPHELLDRYPELTPRIEEELVYRLTDPIVKEAIKGECIVRFTETEQREYIGLIEARKYVYIEEIVRCKDCRYTDEPIYEKDDHDHWCRENSLYVYENDYCSCGERRSDDRSDL